MLRYELSAAIRRKMAADEPAVKAALCALANARFGDTQDAQGIYKEEGGIRVNNREIAIKGAHVIDDWRKPMDAVAEEEAVVAAIAEVSAIVKKDGVAALRQSYGECLTGNPLNALLKGY